MKGYKYLKGYQDYEGNMDEDEKATKMIPIKPSTKDLLEEEISKGETWDDGINRLIRELRTLRKNNR